MVSCSCWADYKASQNKSLSEGQRGGGGVLQYSHLMARGFERGCQSVRKQETRGWLAQSEDDVTLDLGVVSLHPTLGLEITKTKTKTKQL